MTSFDFGLSAFRSFRDDAEGLLRLGFDGIDASLTLAEQSHFGILSALQPFGIGAFTPLEPFLRHGYRALRAVNGLIGRGARAGFSLTPALPAPGAGTMVDPWRDIAIAALNGVIGDHLEASHNPLAITMALRHRGRVLVPGDPATPNLIEGAGDHLLIMVHGLCMADVFWHRYGHHHGRHLRDTLGVTPIGVAYNTGRHISANGRDLAHLIRRLAADWPVPLRRISFLGYSMGGLVTRACHAAARAEGLDWLKLGGHAVYLGSPHHGAPLERGGHALQSMAELNPFLAPLGRMARLRSAGITDLRHGSITAEDRATTPDRFHRKAGVARRPRPLDPAFHHHVVAGTLGRQRGDATDRMMGDGLVPIDSAFGQHADRAYDFALPPEDRLLVRRTGHLDLLSSRPVAARLADWLSE